MARTRSKDAVAHAWAPAGWSVGVLAVMLGLLSIVNQASPEPYMDEPFHVPATQRYCQGDFITWDPKITTFPGLYVLGAGYAWAAHLLLGWAGVTLDIACSAPYLRSLNALLMLACFQLTHAASYELHRRAWAKRRGGSGTGGSSVPGAAVDAAMRQQALWLSLVLTALPTQAFFGLLYYTDVASMAGLLLTQLLLLRGRTWAGAAAAAAAVGVRQTNAVWVSLMMGGAALEELLQGTNSGGGKGEEGQQQKQQQSGGSGSVRRRRGGGAAEAEDGGSGNDLSAADQQKDQQQQQPSLLGELAVALPRLWTQRTHLLISYGPLLTVPVAFAAFVVVNGGITVGDREAHAPTTHLAQPLYFGSFALAAAGPLLAAPGAGGGAAARGAAAVRAPLREAAGWVLAAAVAAAAVARGTLAHPYLLADNRHYTFYLWRRIMMRHPAVRFVLLPAHLLGWRLLLGALLASQRRLWVAAFAAAVVVTLAPAWLLEFRYFTPGLLLGLLHAWGPDVDTKSSGSGSSSSSSKRDGRGGWGLNQVALLVTAAGYAAVNAATVYLFVARPFKWPDGSVARFMW